MTVEDFTHKITLHKMRPDLTMASQTSYKSLISSNRLPVSYLIFEVGDSWTAVDDSWTAVILASGTIDRQ